MPEATEYTCRNCGHRHAGLYCNLCGEKVILPADRSVRKFLTNLIVAFTIVDSVFARTLWMVVRSPGRLSLEYVEGRRVPYIRPLSLFFVLNVLYFMLPRVQLFSSSFRTQLFLTPYGEWIKEAAVRKMVSMNLNLDAFELIYDGKSTSLAKIFIIAFVLIAALPMPALFRHADRYFTDHAALAIELASFNLAVNALLLNLVSWGITGLLGALDSSLGGYVNEASLSSAVALTNLYFLVSASRRFYGRRLWSAVGRSALMLGWLFVALQVYRLLLFWLTLWTL
jgi:hypothetical protein